MDWISTSGRPYRDKVDMYAELTKEDCRVGNDVWIGMDSIIRRGCSVGDGAVIGANSFVNKDVPDFAIVAGSPAKVIGYRFDEIKRKKIIDSDWWNKSLPEAKRIIERLEKEFHINRDYEA